MTPWGTQEVAIKSLTGEISKEDKVKFLQEAAIMAQFRHPHIVRLLGAVTVDEPVGLCGSLRYAGCSLLLVPSQYSHISDCCAFFTEYDCN